MTSKPDISRSEIELIAAIMVSEELSRSAAKVLALLDAKEAAERELAEARKDWGPEECRACDSLRERLSDLLTRTVNVLRGQPKPLHVHSWHDIPELTATLQSKCAALEADARRGRWVCERIALSEVAELLKRCAGDSVDSLAGRHYKQAVIVAIDAALSAPPTGTTGGET